VGQHVGYWLEARAANQVGGEEEALMPILRLHVRLQINRLLPSHMLAVWEVEQMINPRAASH
jgi:hypothetical protein